MAQPDVAVALQRLEAVLQRRPETGLHDDTAALARWEGGMQVRTRHESGLEVATDLPCELGGAGDHVTPGWFVRAGLAACCTTMIAMTAARAGIALTSLEVRADSRSDARGLFEMPDADGGIVSAAPAAVWLQVRIAAPGVAPERLRELAAHACRHSPMSMTVRTEVPLAVQVDVVA
jgi:uncharacterized OsmC-like protein